MMPSVFEAQKLRPLYERWQAYKPGLRRENILIHTLLSGVPKEINGHVKDVYVQTKLSV